MLSNLSIITFHASQKKFSHHRYKEKTIYPLRKQDGQPRYHSRYVYLCVRSSKVRNFTAKDKESLIVKNRYFQEIATKCNVSQNEV